MCRQSCTPMPVHIAQKRQQQTHHQQWSRYGNVSAAFTRDRVVVDTDSGNFNGCRAASRPSIKPWVTLTSFNISIFFLNERTYGSLRKSRIGCNASEPPLAGDSKFALADALTSRIGTSFGVRLRPYAWIESTYRPPSKFRCLSGSSH